MTPAIVISLVAVCITGAGILVQLGRVLSKLDELAASHAEIRAEQKSQRDSLETLRREAAVRDSSVEHIGERVDAMGGHVARLELRVDATPHHGTPVLKPR